MATDYYLILGLTPDAGESQIKRAYRTLSLRHYPDRSEPDERRFLQVKEAYETLRDPVRRSEYHRQLQRDEPVTTQTAPFTPLRRPLDLFGSFFTYDPSPEAIFDAFTRGMTGRGLPKSHHLGELNLEVVLSPAEAATGGHVPLSVPVAHLCSRCDGTGRTGFFHCDDCDGHGTFWHQARVELLIPRGTRDGAVIPVSLRHLGDHPIPLNVHIRVTAASIQ